jgi:hypothetical protein
MHMLTPIGVLCSRFQEPWGSRGCTPFEVKTTYQFQIPRLFQKTSMHSQKMRRRGVPDGEEGHMHASIGRLAFRGATAS